MKILDRLLSLGLFILTVVLACSGGGGGTQQPVQLSDTVPYTISAGHGSGAIVNRIGVLRTWGDNQYHQLGDVSGVNQGIPIKIDPPDIETLWHDVSVGGYHMLAIARKDAQRTLWGWGANESGQAGYWYTLTDVIRPGQIGSDTDWKFISAGYYHSAAIRTGGTLWTWGDNQYGQLGHSGLYSTSPVRVGTDVGWSFVSAGYYHTLALKDTTLYAWGRNTWGQCGNGEYGNTLSDPEYISSGWKQVAAGYTESAGVKLDGTLWAWGGYNLLSFLGNGGDEGSVTPIQIGTDTDWEMVTVGGYGSHKLALKSDGSLWGWGECGNGQLGIGLCSYAMLSPVEVAPGTLWTYIAAGDTFSLGTQKENDPYAWGDNGYGQLGVGCCTDSDVPVAVIIQ
jgi:alpha-tubulin suppressor-like RCC1 family protein